MISSKAWLGLAALAALGAVALLFAARHHPTPEGGSAGMVDSVDSLPRFLPNGDLRRPENWERWVMVGASLGLSYTEGGGAMPMFHRVYIQPWAYTSFQRAGVFPEGTMFALALYRSATSAVPARAGQYEGDRVPVLELHVKRAGLDSTGWGFFMFADTVASARQVPGSASCYACHARDAGFNHVFTQFYPSIRERLRRATTPAAND